MQQKKNKILLITLVVLLATTVVVYVAFNTGDGAYVDKNLFRVADFTAIDRITLTKKDSEIELKFDGARWKVNDATADRAMIDVLFATLQQAEPKRPVASALRDSVNAMIQQQGVAVKLFQGEASQLEFLAGGNATKTQAYFKYPDEDDAYMMVIPGYRVYTSGIFELDELGWKDKYVFNFNWRNFQRLKMLTSNPKNDFEVAMGKAYFEVAGISQVDTTKLNDFLDAVSLLTVDQYVNKEDVPGYDSLLQANPIVEIQVSDVSGKNYTLAFYKSAGPTNILGIIQGAQPAYFDSRKVAGVLRNRNWFVKN